MDSRSCITIGTRSLRHFGAISVLRGHYDLFLLKEVQLGDVGCATTTSFIYKSAKEFIHQDKRAATDLARDSISDDSVKCTTENRVAKLKSIAFSSRAKLWKEDLHRFEPDARVNDSKIIDEAMHILPMVEGDTVLQLAAAVSVVNDLFRANILESSSIGYRWTSLKRRIIPNSILVDLVNS